MRFAIQLIYSQMWLFSWYYSLWSIIRTFLFIYLWNATKNHVCFIWLNLLPYFIMNISEKWLNYALFVLTSSNIIFRIHSFSTIFISHETNVLIRYFIYNFVFTFDDMNLPWQRSCAFSFFQYFDNIIYSNRRAHPKCQNYPLSNSDNFKVFYDAL